MHAGGRFGAERAAAAHPKNAGRPTTSVTTSVTTPVTTRITGYYPTSHTRGPFSIEQKAPRGGDDYMGEYNPIAPN